MWDRDSAGEWYCSSELKGHSGLVWKVAWAHPEFGQILATCSFDRSVCIWVEKTNRTSTPSTLSCHPHAQSGDPHHRPLSEWDRKACLSESRSSVTDVKFSPKHLGLLLATCSSDGTLRIYEAPDIMNLKQWIPQHELNCKIPCSCLSWNPSPFYPPMIAVGSDQPSDSTANSVSQLSTPAAPVSQLQIYESSENTQKWFRVDMSTLVKEPVFDVSFAYNIGRDHHLLAVAGIDVKIFSIKSVSSPSDQSTHQQAYLGSSISGPYSPKYELRQMAIFADHHSKVWRISWNVTGTILASAGEDGYVRLWKCESSSPRYFLYFLFFAFFINPLLSSISSSLSAANYLNAWKAIGVVKIDKARQSEAIGSLVINR